MTAMQSIVKNYDEAKNALEEKCKEHIEYIRKLNTDYVFVPPEIFKDIKENAYKYQIHEVRLMNISQRAEEKKGKEKEWYMQFMLTFENDATEYVYVRLGKGGRTL